MEKRGQKKHQFSIGKQGLTSALSQLHMARMYESIKNLRWIAQLERALYTGDLGGLSRLVAWRWRKRKRPNLLGLPCPDSLGSADLILRTRNVLWTSLISVLFFSSHLEAWLNFCLAHSKSGRKLYPACASNGQSWAQFRLEVSIHLDREVSRLLLVDCQGRNSF